MSLRLTQSMLYSRALQDLRRSSLGLVELQQQVSTGRRVNRPSDDPASMLRILPLTAEIRDLQHMRDNASLAKETLNTSAASLEQASSVMQRLQELVLQGANSTNSARDRKSLSVEVEQLLQQMVGIGNAQRSGSFLFGGTNTSIPPFRLMSDAGGTRVIYDGDQEAHEIDVGPGVTSSVYSPGDSIFQNRTRGLTLVEGETGAAATSSRDTGVGFGKLAVSFRQLNAASLPTGITASADTGKSTAVGSLSYTVSGGQLSIEGGPMVPLPVTNQAFQTGDTPPRTIYLTVASTVTPTSGNIVAEANLSTDGGATVTAVDFSQSQIAVKNSFDGSVVNIDTSAMEGIGEDNITYQGTFDVYTVLIAVRDVLQNDSDAADDKVIGQLRQLLTEIKSAHDGVLDGLQEVGFRSQSLDLVKSRVDSLELSNRESLSLVQDADLAETIMEMTQKQYGFQAALQVSAQVVQTSLLNFLR